VEGGPSAQECYDIATQSGMWAVALAFVISDQSGMLRK
jgi:hypothetical protein